MADKFTELILSDKEKLTKLLNTGGSAASMKAFGQRIFLIETLVAGTTHLKDDPRALEAALHQGDRLGCYREPDNPHDDKAISVRSAEGRKMGYVPRDTNEILARLMDAGKIIYGTVRDKEFVGKWLKITMEIYLDD